MESWSAATEAPAKCFAALDRGVESQRKPMQCRLEAQKAPPLVLPAHQPMPQSPPPVYPATRSRAAVFALQKQSSNTRISPRTRSAGVFGLISGSINNHHKCMTLILPVWVVRPKLPDLSCEPQTLRSPLTTVDIHLLECRQISSNTTVFHYRYHVSARKPRP